MSGLSSHSEEKMAPSPFSIKHTPYGSPLRPHLSVPLPSVEIREECPRPQTATITKNTMRNQQHQNPKRYGHMLGTLLRGGFLGMHPNEIDDELGPNAGNISSVNS